MLKRIVTSLIGLSLLLAGCVGTSTASQPTSVPPTPAEPTPTHIPVDIPPIQMKAIQALAADLGSSGADIHVVSSESVDWPDGCLGIAEPGILCSQIVTPGFRIMLESGGIQYEYRTNLNGSQVESATKAVTWSRNGGIAGFCDMMTIYLPSGAFGNSCKGSTVSGALTAAERDQLISWVKTYGSVDLTRSDNATADSMTVSLDFEGQGTGQPDASVQQQIFDLMGNIYARIQPQP